MARTRRRTTRPWLAGVLLAAGFFSAPVLGQTLADFPAEHLNIDPNGVDLTDGSFNFSLVEGSIGSGVGLLTLERYLGRSGITDNWDGELRVRNEGAATVAIVSFGNIAERFTRSGTDWINQNAGGATITGSDGSYTYKGTDGTTITFEAPRSLYPDAETVIDQCGDLYCALPRTIARPNGLVTSLYWRQVERCIGPNGQVGIPVPGEDWTCTLIHRLQDVRNDADYALKIGYQSDATTPFPPPPAWFTRARVDFFNLSVTPCSVLAASCGDSGHSIVYNYPAGGGTEITGPGDRTWRVSLSAIRMPGSTSDDIVVSYDAAGKVSHVTRNGVATDYAYVVSGSTATMTVTDALGGDRVVISDLSLGRPTSNRDELNRVTEYEYDSSARLTRIEAPENNAVVYDYDTRGNVTRTRVYPKPNSGLLPITTSATFPSGCSNILTCNKPTSTTDALGHVTDYTYSAAHGGVTSVTGPAPVAGQTRPRMRYDYAAVNGVTLLSEVATCVEGGGSCDGNANEIQTVLSYGPNLNLTQVTSGSGEAAGLKATTSLAYDAIGNLVSVDGPLAGTADTTRYRYDAARERVGTISPDPDGAGPLPYRARKIAYNDLGQPTRIDTGTVAGLTDPDWAAMSLVDYATILYTGDHRRRMARLHGAGGTIRALTQYGYDALGRLECTAVRMNRDAYGSLPADACAPGTPGTHGPDRIARIVYDAAGQVHEVRDGVGISRRDVATTLYTDNGRVETVTDAEGNRTTYEYDPYDRLRKTRFPDKNTPGASSTTDYEELTYDGGSRVTSRRLRDGQAIAFQYDDLNRLTLKNLPGDEVSVVYAYDWADRLLSATQGAVDVTYVHDPLSRVTETTFYVAPGVDRTLSYRYDLAGRRIRLTWDDAFFVAYDHLVTGEVTRVRENGVVSGVGVLATYAYDDIGRLASIARGNGTSTGYGYDTISRLDALTQELTGTADDLALTFAYNPAGQIASSTRSNESYSFDDHAEGLTPSTANGLNQLTQVGGQTLGYDPRGNLVSDPTAPGGTTTYTYSSENLLTDVAQGATVLMGMRYDPLLRLNRVTGSGQTRRFGWDGTDLIAEYDYNGDLVRRYVHGPGIDTPIVWYEGVGTTERRWLHADERGSIVAASDVSGAATAKNTYDEYGIPGAGNAGRFQYTGQMWIDLGGPTASTGEGLYYYKARFYDPRLGRFMQTDPIGYAGGMNLYAYVRGDPVNLIDPTGLQCTGSRIAEACPNNTGVASGYSGSTYLGPGAAYNREGGGGSVLTCVKWCNNPPAGVNAAGEWVVYAPPQFAWVSFYDALVFGYEIYGKMRAAPATVAGLFIGIIGTAASEFAGGDGSITTGNNAIQFVNSPFAIPNTAYTLGNVQIYGSGLLPDDVIISSYTGQELVVGGHEEGHTYQYETLGVGGFLGRYTVEGLGGPLDVGADNFATQRGSIWSGY